ncbi:cyclase family protein [uncultured Desulfobulbus sp.]|uniref:cyclase family protein n=1 Tax=uncultured Desulfobulbus sp. TaxID=239745 RepID=UPI0029C6C58D|nr:cyclase family protein [uncultured Desulfobulbus sp.]
MNNSDKKLRWLSYPLGINDPRPPAIPAPELTNLYTVDADDAAVQIIKVASHTGTHVDAPAHVVKDGVEITEYSPYEFIFTKPVIIDLQIPDACIVQPLDLEPFRDVLNNADIALFRFGCGNIRLNDPQRFSLRSPGFGAESAKWLRDNCPNLRAIGIDVPSLACIAHLDVTMAAHNRLLEGAGCRFLVIEDMKLDDDLVELVEVRISPWLVSGMDSGPCSVVGIVV